MLHDITLLACSYWDSYITRRKHFYQPSSINVHRKGCGHHTFISRIIIATKAVQLIYNHSILDEKQLLPKQYWLRSHKSVIHPMTVTVFEHMLLLTENKRKLCVRAPNNCNTCDYLYNLAYSYPPPVCMYSKCLILTLRWQ